jgi:hypothetical protein
MTGRGLITNTVTKSSQIKGHIHGWTVGSPARAKESQKAQQRDARAIQGIYDLCSISFLQESRNLLEMYLEILPMIKTRSNIQI